jgi:molybdenum cofactor cytidylyltransferase
MRVVGILLAAGRGTRFGGDKLLAPLRRAPGVPPGTPLGVAAAAHLVAALPDSLAVVRPADARLSRRLRDAGLRIVECDAANPGIGASLACGVAAAADADAWVVALADMPWIAPATIAGVAAALASGAQIVAPSYRGERGHPVGFARGHYASLAASTGDAGARRIIERARDCVTLLDCDDPGVLRDVDTRGALQARD